MMSRFYAIATVLIFALFVVSCSGGGSAPISPDLKTVEKNPAETTANANLWGVWDVTIDPVAGIAEAVPIRGAEFTADVVQFMQPPKSSKQLLSIYLDPSSDFPSGHVITDVTFTHPFPGLDTYTGFDVRGVCIGDGEISGIIDPDIFYAGEDDLRILNADGLTRWFNPSEFSTYETLFGFTKGKLGTPSVSWTATLNGYKYFCNGLGKDDDLADFFTNPSCPNPRGYFSSGNSLTRHYDLQFPVVGGTPQFKFQYAVVANWMKPLVDPPANIPDDFSIDANCPEAFAFYASDQSDMYYLDGVGSGGSLKLDLKIYDHQGAADLSAYADEISAIHLETPDGLIDGNAATFEGAELAAAFAGISGNAIEYSLTVDGVIPYAVGDFPVMVIIESADPDSYDSGFPAFAYPTDAKLASYFMASVHVGDEVPFLDPVAVASITSPISDYYKGDHLKFDASESYDPDNDPPTTDGIVDYEWDWDNDGTFDEESTDPTAVHTWDDTGVYYVQLRVTDDEGMTDTLDQPIEIEVGDIPEAQLIAKLTGLHSPYFSQVDTKKDNGWTDCTEGAPIVDFGFYRIDNSENMEKVFQKNGSGFFGMPGPFVVSTEARKILAPSMLSLGSLLVDMWDLDGGSGKQFYLPMDPDAGIFFCGDVELFANLSTAVLSDPIANRLVVWDYTVTSPTYDIYDTSEFPDILEGDYEGNRLFVYSRNSGTSMVEIWDAENWTIIDTFLTNNPDYPSMSDMDFDPYWQQLYFAGGTGGDLEIWDGETYSYIKTILTGYGQVAGVDHMGGGVFVTVPGHLLGYDAETLNLLWDIAVPGANLQTVACNPNTHKMYIPDMDQSVYVFQL